MPSYAFLASSHTSVVWRARAVSVCMYTDLINLHSLIVEGQEGGGRFAALLDWSHPSLGAVVLNVLERWEAC